MYYYYDEKPKYKSQLFDKSLRCIKNFVKIPSCYSGSVLNCGVFHPKSLRCLDVRLAYDIKSRSEIVTDQTAGEPNTNGKTPTVQSHYSASKQNGTETEAAGMSTGLQGMI